MRKTQNGLVLAEKSQHSTGYKEDQGVNMMTCKRAYRIVLSAMVLLLVVIDARSDTIDYKFVTSIDETHTALFDYGGVTVTGGPRLVNVNLSNGLSIIGGGNDYAVDSGEFLTFALNAGAATNVSFRIQVCCPSFPLSATLDAFGTGGSLGPQVVGGIGVELIPGFPARFLTVLRGKL